MKSWDLREIDNTLLHMPAWSSYKQNGGHLDEAAPVVHVRAHWPAHDGAIVTIDSLLPVGTGHLVTASTDRTVLVGVACVLVTFFCVLFCAAP